MQLGAGALSGRVDGRYRGSDHAAVGEPVKGHVYLARPVCGGAGEAACTEQDALDGNLYKLYLELGGTGALADTGIKFKVPGMSRRTPRRAS